MIWVSNGKNSVRIVSRPYFLLMCLFLTVIFICPIVTAEQEQKDNEDPIDISELEYSELEEESEPAEAESDKTDFDFDEQDWYSGITDNDRIRLFWGAYYKNEISYWDRSELEEKWGDFNKIRFILEGRMLRGLKLKAEVNVFSFHGNTRLYYSDQNRATLDRGFLYIPFDSLDLTIGKQEIKWGPGLLWSPTDIFNPFDLTVFHDEERDGESAFKIDYFLSDTFSLSAVITPAFEEDYFRKAIQFNTFIENHNFQLSLMEYKDIVTKNHFIINSFSVNHGFEGGRYWFEGAYILEDNEDRSIERHYVKANTGFGYMTPIGVFLLAEFFYDDGGKEKAEEYTTEEWQNYLNGRLQNLGQVYSYWGCQTRITEALALNLGYIKNYSDKSSYFYLFWFYAMYDNTEILLGIDLTYGSEDTEFSIFGNSYSLALKLTI